MCNEKFAYSVFCSLHLYVPSRTTVTTAGPKSRLDPLTLTSANAVGLLTVSGITHTATAGPANSNQQPATSNTNWQPATRSEPQQQQSQGTSKICTYNYFS